MKVALITGASSGMGLEYARQLAARGHDLLVVSNQEEQLLEVTAGLVEDYSVNVIPHYQDLATDDAAEKLVEFCEGEGLEVDTLVCNAGMFFFKELHPGDKGRVEAMMRLHMTTPTKLCLLLGEKMKERGEGHILLMSSMAAKLPMPGITVYSATKAYLKSFGRSLYFEMRPYGVGVTTVCPAAIATPLYHLSQNLLDFGVRIGVIWTAERLVRRALRAMEHNRRSIRPGFMNIYLPPMIAAIPKCIVDRLWKRFK